MNLYLGFNHQKIMGNADSTSPDQLLNTQPCVDIDTGLNILEEYLLADPHAEDARIALTDVLLQVNQLARALPHLRWLAAGKSDSHLLSVLAKVCEALQPDDLTRRRSGDSHPLQPFYPQLTKQAIRLAYLCDPVDSFRILDTVAPALRGTNLPFDLLGRSLHNFEKKLHSRLYRNQADSSLKCDTENF